MVEFWHTLSITNCGLLYYDSRNIFIDMTTTLKYAAGVIITQFGHKNVAIRNSKSGYFGVW